MNLKDFKEISLLIDDIIGLNTNQGSNLKKAVKNYFDTKPVNVKLVATDKSYNIRLSKTKHTKGADEAMERYTEKLKLETSKLKEKGEYCGVSG